KTSKTNRASWEKFIRKYLRDRENLQCVFILIDSRLEPQKVGLEFCSWLGEERIPFRFVFTKADKQSVVKADQNMAHFRKELLKWFEEMPAVFLTSSENRLGCEQVLQFIDEVNQAY